SRSCTVLLEARPTRTGDGPSGQRRSAPSSVAIKWRPMGRKAYAGPPSVPTPAGPRLSQAPYAGLRDAAAITPEEPMSLSPTPFPCDRALVARGVFTAVSWALIAAVIALWAPGRSLAAGAVARVASLRPHASTLAAAPAPESCTGSASSTCGFANSWSTGEMDD